jgi:hypothetical protein
MQHALNQLRPQPQLFPPKLYSEFEDRPMPLDGRQAGLTSRNDNCADQIRSCHNSIVTVNQPSHLPLRRAELCQSVNDSRKTAKGGWVKP